MVLFENRENFPETVDKAHTSIIIKLKSKVFSGHEVQGVSYESKFGL